ncbi:hypothetical protein [Yoonia sp.]|uniref:hypothetical protein n=1 Tax=Yoonia sp. TaxID=2212373 RepID=UPI00391DDC82
MTRFLPALFFLVFAGSAIKAEVKHYDLMLGQRQLGGLGFDTVTLDLVSDLDNTPLGVADGHFTAQTRPARTAEGNAVTHYLAQSAERQISVVVSAGQVISTNVTPMHEATAASAPEAVPAGTIVLNEGFAKIAMADTCPAPFTMYDGRRVMQIATLSQSADAAGTLCDMDYHVIAGPGHLSPFRFTRLNMALLYREGVLRLITVRAGGFELRMVAR